MESNSLESQLTDDILRSQIILWLSPTPPLYSQILLGIVAGFFLGLFSFPARFFSLIFSSLILV